MNPTRPVAPRAGRSTSDDGSLAVAATRFGFGFTFLAGSSGAWGLPTAGRDALGRGERDARAGGSGPGSRPHRPPATGEGR